MAVMNTYSKTHFVRSGGSNPSFKSYTQNYLMWFVNVGKRAGRPAEMGRWLPIKISLNRVNFIGNIKRNCTNFFAGTL